MKMPLSFAENHYGLGAALFQRLCHRRELKLLVRGYVEKLALASVLFRNCYVCLYGNLSSKRFKVDPPYLREYLSWTDDYYV